MEFPRPARPVLIVNPRSGGGKAQRHDVVGRCRAKGIEPVVFERGEELSVLAVDAVRRGADTIGVAGGDGSQAAVAAIAAEYDVPFVCIPVGTRNHFALDVGIDRNDVAGALDAFFEGSERRIDLASMNGRVFVNNASMGLYGKIIQSKEYREAKLRTVIETLPQLVGPDAEPFDLRFTDQNGSRHRSAQLLLVSNNRYVVDPLGAEGTRRGVDQGKLGIVIVRRGPPSQGWMEWSAPAFEVDSGELVDVGLDGEALAVEPPLKFKSLPSALRIRVPIRLHHRQRQR